MLTKIELDNNIKKEIKKLGYNHSTDAHSIYITKDGYEIDIDCDKEKITLRDTSDELGICEISKELLIAINYIVILHWNDFEES